MSRRIISFLVFFAIFSSLLSVSAGAVDVTSTGTFWQNVAKDSPGWLRGVLGVIDSGICLVSEDGKHHGKLITDEPVKNGYFHAQCDHCSEVFPVHESALEDAYQKKVQELPGSSYTSSGNFRVYLDGWKYRTSATQHYVVNSKTEYPYLVYIKNNGGYDSLSMLSSPVTLPVTGKYRLVFPLFTSFENMSFPTSGSSIVLYQTVDGSSSQGVRGWNYKEVWDAGVRGVLEHEFSGAASNDVTYTVSVAWSNPQYNGSSAVNIVESWARPYIELISAYDQGPSDYHRETRPSSIVGNYGIIGDNGQITKVDSTSIVNETNSIVYNPVTNTTSNIQEWTYDYINRSYDVTLDNGTKQTITYGDEYISIREGDTVYNVYYINSTPGPGSGSGGGGSGQPGTDVPDIVAPSIDIPGFTPGTQNPGGGEEQPQKESLWTKIGNIFGAIGEGALWLLEAAVGKILDGLLALIENLGAKLKKVIEAVLSWFDELPKLFGGFLDFLGAGFSFLPEDTILLLNFGITAIVFIGIIKALKR